MTTLEIHPDYRAAVEASGLASFDALFAAGESGRVDGHGHRSVSRLELRGPGGEAVVIYLKRQWGPGARPAWGDLTRMHWPCTAAEREWTNSLRLTRAGIPVAAPVAWGRSTDGGESRTLVAFREVRGPSLAAWLHAAQENPPAPALRRAVAEAVGQAVRQLHDGNFSFLDLYGKHLFLEDLASGWPRVVLIDVVRLRRFFSWRAAADLAALHVSTARLGVTRTDRLRVLRAYMGATRLGAGGRNLFRAIAGRAARIPDRGQDPNLIRKRGPTDAAASPTINQVSRIDDGRVWILNEVWPLLEAAGLTTLDNVFELSGGETYRAVPGRSTVRIEVPDPEGGRRAWYLKRYSEVPWRVALRRMVSLNPPVSMAEREIRSIVRVTDLGIPTLRWLAFGGELTARGRRERSFLITEELAGAEQADKYFEARFAGVLTPEQTALKRRLIRAAADIARRMHEARLSHRDFYLCHLLVRPAQAGADPTLHLIDLQRLTHHRRGIGRRWIIKDLAAMLFSSWPSAATFIRSKVFTQTDRMRFARAYFGGGRLTDEQKGLIREVVAKAKGMAKRQARRANA